MADEDVDVLLPEQLIVVHLSQTRMTDKTPESLCLTTKNPIEEDHHTYYALISILYSSTSIASCVDMLTVQCFTFFSLRGSLFLPLVDRTCNSVR